MLDFDDMLLQVGEFGLYQKALFAFQAPFCIFVTFVLFGQLFMTLYPLTVWCSGHYNCTMGSMTPFQRHNFSFPVNPGGIHNPCFINNIDASFVINVVNMINGANCGDRPCNYTHGAANPTAPNNVNPSVPSLSPVASPPENYYSKGYEYAREHGPSPQSKSESVGYGRWGTRGYGGGWQYTTATTTTTTTSTTTPSWEESSEHEFGGEEWNTLPPGPAFTTTSTNNPNFGRDRPNDPTVTSSTNKPRPTGRYQPPSAPKTTQRSWAQESPTESPNPGFGRRPVTPTTFITTFPTRRPIFSDSGIKTGASGSREFGNVAGSALPFSSNKTCSRFENITLSNRSRIFLPEFNAAGTTTAGSFLVPHRTPMYVPVEQCYNVTYDPRTSGTPYPTIVTEGGWWCRAVEYTTAAQAVFFLGAIVGGFLIGYIADSYGRVPALVIANLLGAVGGALSVISTNIWLFMLFRFITGMAFDNCFTMMYILVLEFCGPTYRTLVANLSIAVFYTLGTLILPVLALQVGNWRIYGLAISLPMLMGLLAIFFVPESARWLLSKGRTKEATDILRSFAKVNRQKVDERVFVEFERDAAQLYNEMQDDEEEQSFTAALKTPRLRKTFILLTLIWSIIALVYDGHSRNILNLADQEWNVFWMFSIASMTEFPADMLLIFTLDRFGRRWLSFGSLTLSGAASIIAATIPPQMRTIGLVMAIISRFFVNVSFNIGLQYAAELLPTVIRAQGVNAIHIMGYVASFISPFVAGIGRTNPALSLILLGSVAIIGGCLSLFLSETLGEDLPNNLEEAEQFGINQSFWNCPICAKPKDDDHMPIDEAPNPEVIRRNNMRSTMRGETYRSSIISNSSRASRRRFPNVALDPSPANENTKLRRITH